MTELTNEQPNFYDCVTEALHIIKQDYSQECLEMATTPEYVEDAVAQLISAGYRRATPSSDCVLPPLPEPDHSLDGGTLHFYTAEQVEQIRREAVEADRRARVNAPVPRWVDDQKGKDPLMDDMIGYIADLRAQLARQSQGAPVAWKYRALAGNGEWRVTLSEDWARSVNGDVDVVPLYAAPPLSSEPQESA